MQTQEASLRFPDLKDWRLRVRSLIAWFWFIVFYPFTLLLFLFMPYQDDCDLIDKILITGSSISLLLLGILIILRKDSRFIRITLLAFFCLGGTIGSGIIWNSWLLSLLLMPLLSFILYWLISPPTANPK